VPKSPAKTGSASAAKITPGARRKPQAARPRGRGQAGLGLVGLGLAGLGLFSAAKARDPIRLDLHHPAGVRLGQGGA
jgi:hypothetical protein